MQKSFSLKRLYFTLISIVWIIWMMIGYGTLIYTLVNGAIITNEEYIAGWNYSYPIKECENPYVKPEWQSVSKTSVEIQKCKDEATKTVLQTRAYNKKIDVINWIVRWTLFLILFITHFPFMMKKEE